MGKSTPPRIRPRCAPQKQRLTFVSQPILLRLAQICEVQPLNSLALIRQARDADDGGIVYNLLLLVDALRRVVDLYAMVVSVIVFLVVFELSKRWEI